MHCVEECAVGATLLDESGAGVVVPGEGVCCVFGFAL